VGDSWTHRGGPEIPSRVWHIHTPITNPIMTTNVTTIFTVGLTEFDVSMASRTPHKNPWNHPQNSQNHIRGPKRFLADLGLLGLRWTLQIGAQNENGVGEALCWICRKLQTYVRIMWGFNTKCESSRNVCRDALGGFGDSGRDGDCPGFPTWSMCAPRHQRCSWALPKTGRWKKPLGSEADEGLPSASNLGGVWGEP
jgi:hypothetical protein